MTDTNSKLLSAEDIINAPDIQVERVEVPEWNGHVYVKSLAGIERDEFEGSLVKGKGKDKSISFTNIRAKLVARTACDANGKLIFTIDQIEKLGKKSAGALQRVFSVAQRLSGLTDDDVKELSGELKNDQPEDLHSV